MSGRDDVSMPQLRGINADLQKGPATGGTDERGLGPRLSENGTLNFGPRTCRPNDTLPWALPCFFRHLRPFVCELSPNEPVAYRLWLAVLAGDNPRPSRDRCRTEDP